MLKADKTSSTYSSYNGAMLFTHWCISINKLTMSYIKLYQSQGTFYNNYFQYFTLSAHFADCTFALLLRQEFKCRTFSCNEYFYTTILVLVISSSSFIHLMFLFYFCFWRLKGSRRHRDRGAKTSETVVYRNSRGPRQLAENENHPSLSQHVLLHRRPRLLEMRRLRLGDQMNTFVIWEHRRRNVTSASSAKKQQQVWEMLHHVNKNLSVPSFRWNTYCKYLNAH